MGVIDAPQWLLPAYIRSMKSVGATAPLEQLQASGERLVSMWRSPDRCFHNLKHAIDMLARVDELADESHNPDIMRLAVWYHGCIFSSASEQTYKRNGGEDEIASAAYAAQDLSALGVPDKVTDRVCALILNLKRHNLTGEDIDAQALLDADLGTLAVEPQLYKRYRELVRQEYAHIPDRPYLTARLAIITRLLEREHLFRSPLGQRWELPARQNLDAERRRVTDQLAALDDAATDASDGAGHGEGTGLATDPQDPTAPAADNGASRSDGAPRSAPHEARPSAVAAGAPAEDVATSRGTGASTTKGAATGSVPTPAAAPVSGTAAVTEAGATGVAAAAGGAAADRHGAHSPAAPEAGAAPSTAGSRSTTTTSPSGVRRVSVLARREAPAPSRRPAQAARDAAGLPASPAAPVAPAPPTARATPVALATSRADTEDMLEHTTTMEACVEDIDRLMTAPRQAPAPAVVRRSGSAPTAPDRRSIVAAAQSELADRLEAKARQAREAREARTGELATITGEVPVQDVDDDQL